MWLIYNGDATEMQFRWSNRDRAFTTYTGGWVVGILKSMSNAKLNSILRLKLKLELSLAIKHCPMNADFLFCCSHYFTFICLVSLYIESFNVNPTFVGYSKKPNSTERLQELLLVKREWTKWIINWIKIIKWNVIGVWVIIASSKIGIVWYHDTKLHTLLYENFWF